MQGTRMQPKCQRGKSYTVRSFCFQFMVIDFLLYFFPLIFPMVIHLDCNSVSPIKMKKHSLHQVVHPSITKLKYAPFQEYDIAQVCSEEKYRLRRICLKHQTSRNNNALTYTLLFVCNSC
ncbi:hypothetical protein V8G54_012679 [Vigna mungo]|uniref:Uncharacterized protein n=1 Tax=Vigna mungo TaxID=3915 RepID=A0AAQ3NV76_VIGMU